MTLRIHSTAYNSEQRNAELLAERLRSSEPMLDHPDVDVQVLYGLPLPQRQLDIVLLYHDTRPSDHWLKRADGVPVHSFVLVIEVKHHSPDNIKFSGPKLLVRYSDGWTDATAQCEEQTYALKAYVNVPYSGIRRRAPPYVQRAIWLARASYMSFTGRPAESSVPVHFGDITWAAILERLDVNAKQNSVRTLADRPDDPKHHSAQTICDRLLHQVRPTQLDLRRVNALTQTRFDAEKTAYIQNLGKGLLMLKGRGGTGKTFALVQIALHLAKQGKRTLILTYNHGLISDIARALLFIVARDQTIVRPIVQTRYSFVRDLFKRAFDNRAEKYIINGYPNLGDRELARLKMIMRADVGIKPPFDFVLVDEGQDWTEAQRDFLFSLFGAEHVVIADGVDQFVGPDRCNWDRGDIPINRRHRLHASRRTKGATCQTIGEIARELGLSDWDLEPDPDAHGGRLTVLVEPVPALAVDSALRIIARDQQVGGTINPVDNLICLPTTKMGGGYDYSKLFDRAIEAKSLDSWRGFDETDRRVYPIREAQLRAIYYQSCRGMEGWSTACLGLDDFYQFQLDNALIDPAAITQSVREKDGLFYSERSAQKAVARARKLFANNWLMIPLTRSIDHLVLHIRNEDSELGRVLHKVSARSTGAISWMRSSPVHATPPFNNA